MEGRILVGCHKSAEPLRKIDPGRPGKEALERYIWPTVACTFPSATAEWANDMGAWDALIDLVLYMHLGWEALREDVIAAQRLGPDMFFFIRSRSD